MKKIIISLFFITSFLFSASSITYKGFTATYPEGCLDTFIDFTDYPFSFFENLIATRPTYDFTFVCDGVVHRDYMTTHVCPEPNIIDERGFCVPDSIPTCPTGAHNDTTQEGSPCVSDYEMNAKETFDNGNVWIQWADGATTFCELATGQCLTHDKNANRIDNRYIDPIYYADGETLYGNFSGRVPVEAPQTPSLLELALNPILQATQNAVGKTLQAFGMGIMVTGTGDGVLMYDGYQGLNLLNPLMAIGGGIFTLGNALVTPDNVIVTTPTADESALMNVNIIERTSDSTLNTIENATPSDGTPAMTPNGAYTQKQVTEANLKTIWDTAAGVGKLPPNALVLGSDIIHPTDSPTTAIINTPNTIKFVETKPDNTSTVIEVAKTALAQTATNNTDLTYTKTDYQAPTINNDGTTSQGSTISTGTVASTTNNNTVTSSTGTTTTANPTTGTSTTAGTTSSTGSTGTIDLAGVTSRLDKISNQMTKLNDGFSSDIETHANNIPSDTSVVKWTTYESTWNNLLSSIDSVGSKVSEVQSLFQNGFTLNLTGGTVTTCQHTFTLNLTGSPTDVKVDFCSVLSPFRPVIYTFFYLFFVASIIMFSFKIMIRMV